MPTKTASIKTKIILQLLVWIPLFATVYAIATLWGRMITLTDLVLLLVGYTLCALGKMCIRDRGLVHLAGESILGVWTREKRRRILESRVEGTRRLVEGIAAIPETLRPRVLVSASAIGFYGETGDRVVDEDSPAGSGFLSEVTQAWEAEAMKATLLGVRLVCLRIGFVLGRGGAMKLVAPIFRAGLGGRLGSGRQWMSCIGVDDLALMVAESLRNESISGALNAVMPSPVTNAEDVYKRQALREPREELTLRLL